MDFNLLFEMIKNLSEEKEIVLGDMRKDGKTIYLELELVEPVNEELQKVIKEDYE